MVIYNTFCQHAIEVVSEVLSIICLFKKLLSTALHFMPGLVGTSWAAGS